MRKSIIPAAGWGGSAAVEGHRDLSLRDAKVGLGNRQKVPTGPQWG
jgi:hypothetical protein